MGRPKIMAKRKILSLPVQLIEQIDEYRYRNKIPTEADAIRSLIQIGISASDSPEALYERIASSSASGMSYSEIAREILSGHALVYAIDSIPRGDGRYQVVITLKTGHRIEQGDSDDEWMFIEPAPF